jgi:hypothetical protein
MSCVSRRVPRSSERTRASVSGSSPRSWRRSRSSSIEASWAESGVRNSCEMLAKTESRSRRAASTSVSSRSTWNWWSSAGGALVTTTARRVPSASSRFSVARVAPRKRACRIGH